MAVAARVAASARADLEDLRAWYAERGAPEAGERVVAGIVERVEDLADNPDLGRVVPEFEQPLLRELIQPPFRIVYWRDEDVVRVVRVWRGERQLRPFTIAPGGGRPRSVSD